MNIAGFGAFLVIMGLGILIMAAVTAFMNTMPPRSTRLEVIRKKRSVGDALTNSEELEERQANFERKLPAFGFVCLLVGAIAIII